MREEAARRRNRELISHLEESGVLTDPAVAAAFRAVHRHHFLPGRRLSYVYEDTAIPTKRDDQGTATSSSSQPAIMALMLQQLALQPGQRVLEIGAGTGYNAALIANVVGPEGLVCTLEIDDEVSRQARANLAAAGVQGVQVMHADGAAGWPAEAPFDRIIVTASVDDLAMAWLDQLPDGGHLVAPLALAGPMQLCTAFVKEGRALISESLSGCGFLPLRGEMAFESASDPAESARDSLALPGRPTWQSIPPADVRGGFEVWLGLAERGYIRLRLRPEDPPVFGLAEGGGVALVVPERDGLWIYAYGDAEAATTRLTAAHRQWAERRPKPQDLRIVARPVGQGAPANPGQLVFHRPRFDFQVSQP
jgi:protein-L-isoaspartate(D-aspartate) O-methyltransferase